MNARAREARTARSNVTLKFGLAALVLSLASVSSCTDDEVNGDASLPPAPDDSCARFAMQFSPGECSAATCAEPLCRCGDSTIRCLSNFRDRCLYRIDCTRACAEPDIVVLRCATQFVSCAADADCGGGFCVVDADAKSGACESGERGARCRRDEDCRVGHCVAGNGGTRACSPGEKDDTCNRDEDCLSTHCTRGGAPFGDCVDSR